MGREVHHHKGDIGHTVDPAQGGVELDGIEQLGLAIDECNVGQMQIAMAFAHPTGCPPCLECGGQGPPLVPAPADHLR